ncbi:MAG TPA: SAM-dependent methyltransferase, partial [Trebonia sp.]
MKEGTASHTARSVAAHRLDYTRAAAAHGDPAADEALARDVAAGLAPKAGRMHEYLRGRTDFFDRAVTDALGRGVSQVIAGGAGYDGRALRYAGPGVHWFEVDHPATQADKRERLARLGLDARSVRFIAADFTADPVAGPLLEAGLDPARDTLVLLEGVAVYLDRPVLERVLGEFRRAVPAGSTLAVSVSVRAPQSGTRVRFQQRAATAGEPARTVLTAEQAAGLLAGAGWEVRPGSGRQRSAGLLLARAVTAPARSDPPAPPERDRLAPGRPNRRPSGLASPRPAALPPGPARLPLSALLSQALTAFTIEADNEAEHRLPHRTTSYGATDAGGPWLTSLLMWANCLRHLPDEGITLAELHARARTGTNLDGMRRWGYVTFTPDPARGRRPPPGTLIRPTAGGRAARQTWAEATEATEARWRGRLGPGPFDALGAALAGVGGYLDPALPDCLPILGYGLATRP